MVAMSGSPPGGAGGVLSQLCYYAGFHQGPDHDEQSGEDSSVSHSTLGMKSRGLLDTAVPCCNRSLSR